MARVSWDGELANKVKTPMNIKWVYSTNVSIVSPVRDGLLECVVPPFSPVSEPRLEWNVGLFSLDPDAAPCRRTQETSAEDNLTVEVS